MRAGVPSCRMMKLFVLILLSLTAASAWAQQQTISQIRVIGNRRIPKETVLARIFSRVGEPYDPLTVERDFNSLWNTGYFEDVRIEKEDSPQGAVLDIYVREKPTIREINYKGLNSVTLSDVLDRYKKEKTGLSVESQYDPTRIAAAVTVLRELLAEHGHQFATIKTDIKTIPPASVQVNFLIKEGPKVKVGKIQFVGNDHVSSRILRESMKNLRPVGIPHSIFLENLFAKTYDASKLEEDSERVRQAYRDRGYLRGGPVGEPQTHIRNEGGLSWITFRPRKGKDIDIKMNIDEGQRYRLAGITFSGNKAVTNAKALRAQFAMKDGDWFNATAFGKGLDNLRKAYGQLGYINFTGIPNPTFDDAKHTVTFNVDIDEGKPFYVSRIEFQGNTVTRDFVIRRELLLQEGQIYNSHLWELSLMRLNQLDYFDPLKVDQDSETHQNAENGTVDLLLKVHEKGKNSIGLNGGVSGLSGSFLGLNYQTNNFLGLGETLTVQASVGDLARNLVFSFNEPYVRNKPLNLGFSVFDSKSDYNASKNYQVTGSAANLSAATTSLLQNYNQSSTGFTISGSYPLKHFSKFGFPRFGVTYSFNDSSIRTFSAASANLFQTLAFRSGIQGQNALQGIVNSSASFSLSINKLDSTYMPHTGQELSAAFQISGLWGNVRYIRPVIEFRQFRPIKGLWFNPEGRNTFGYRLQAAYIRGISGDVAPPFDRLYQGGESDLRGFDVRSGTPYGFVPTRVQFALTNPDGSTVPRDPNNPNLGPIEVPLPVYGIASIGGDANFTSNFEYRIPIYARTVAFNIFDDFGLDMALDRNQLRQSPQGLDALTSPLYGCPNYVNGACQGGFPIKFSPNIDPISGTNFVPRMSAGGELDVMMPIINAPFRLYYAFNPLRLEENFTRQDLITRAMFPSGGAGDYSYARAEQFYNGLYQLREPRKTFRLAVSTTF
ncbi:outer membrane protein assembly factor BamA [Acidipila sp. 4G-K13]|uniref:Outer membrane protein assembly factor BamA n=2 Tax=Paracidobacterium acidisoli TaxID=2303751 RepID=A0A372ILE1_9BACT|nr:outer membrane protein assembly factor BamA [Paracidobacterium acidisoli]